jgi:hypothetical protein
VPTLSSCFATAGRFSASSSRCSSGAVARTREGTGTFAARGGPKGAFAQRCLSPFRCPVCLLIVTQSETVARWAAQPIDLGGGNHFRPHVLGPAGIPIVDDDARARADPELAVLSAMAHGRDRNQDLALRVAVAAMGASAGLDPERSRLYFDLVAASLGEAARKALQAMDPTKYEFQSEFARRYIALGKTEGKAEGRAEGKADLLTRLLTRRFGRLSASVRERLAAASPAEVDRCAERLLDATSIDEVFGDR